MKEIIIKKTEKQKELQNILNRINGNIKDVGLYIRDILTDLYYIQKKELFFYDKCNSLRQFIIKNKIKEKLSISIRGIYDHVEMIDYGQQNKLSVKEVFNLGVYKLKILKKENILGRNKILNFENYTILEVKKELGYMKDKTTGRFIKKDDVFYRRKNTVLKNIMFEVLKDKLKDFEKDLVKICQKNKIRIV